MLKFKASIFYEVPYKLVHHFTGKEDETGRKMSIADL